MPKIIGGSLVEHREQVRERLQNAVLRLLEERGYDAVSLADIAAAAGVGRTAVYNHFPDKESVLLALVQSQTAQYLERLEAALAEVSNPVDGLAVFVRMQAHQIAASHLHLAGLRPALSGSGRRKIYDHVAPMARILEDLLREGMAQGYLPEQDLATLVPLVFAATDSRGRTTRSGPELDSAVDAAVLFVLRGAGARLGPGMRPRRLQAAGHASAPAAVR